MIPEVCRPRNFFFSSNFCLQGHKKGKKKKKKSGEVYEIETKWKSEGCIVCMVYAGCRLGTCIS